MQSLLVDVGEDVPKDEGACQKVEDERWWGRCNFRKVCDYEFINIGDQLYFHQIRVA